MDQVSPTLDSVTHFLGEGRDTDQERNQNGSRKPYPGPSDPFPGKGGVTDQGSNQSGLSEPHPGLSDPFPGRGVRYRPGTEPKWIKKAIPWTQWPVPWGRGELIHTRKATNVDQISPTMDPVTHSLGEGGGGLETRKATKMDQVSPNWGNGSYSFVETSPEMLARCWMVTRGKPLTHVLC